MGIIVFCGLLLSVVLFLLAPMLMRRPRRGDVGEAKEDIPMRRVEIDTGPEEKDPDESD